MPAKFGQLSKGSCRQGGFTLIELLVVIAIIGLLASVVLVALNSARMKSRDARRVADMNQVAKALELFYNDYAAYPTGTGSVGSGYTQTGGAVMGTLQMQAITTLGTGSITPTYISKMPTAPAPPDNNAGGTTCNTTNNQYYYEADARGSTYTITFCLGSNNVIGQLPGGIHSLTPGGFR